MKIQTEFGNWEVGNDGTVSDLQNGLMWARSPLGTNGIGSGSLLRDSWENISHLYGSGVPAYASKGVYGLGNIVCETIKITGRDRGYTVGRERLMHAGVSRWRLPTLDEVSTITFDEGWGGKKVGNGESNPNEIISKLFQEACFGESFWVANKCWEPKEIRTLFGLSPKKPPVVWAFHMQPPIHMSEVDGDNKRAALLVRNMD